MSTLISAAVTAALLIASAAPARDRQTAIAPPAGKALDCLQLREIRETRVRDDRTIDFYTYGRRVYRNTLPFSCPELGFEEAFGYKTSLAQLCSVDTITVIHHGGGSIPGATCGLGPFQPVTIANERGIRPAR